MGADRNILSNRAPKLMNQINKNINIIGEDQNQCVTPYEGMFALSNNQPRSPKSNPKKSPVSQMPQPKGIKNDHIKNEHNQFVNDIMRQKQSHEIEDQDEKSIIKDIVKSMVNTQYTSTTDALKPVH